VTYKILRQYYNSHFYIKNKKEDNLKFNLDASTSYISMIDNYFHNKAHKSEKHSKKNIVKSIKKDGFNNSFNVKQKRQSSIQLSNDIKIKHNSSFGSGLSSFRGVSKFHHKNSQKFNSEKFTRPREKGTFTFRKNDNYNTENTLKRSFLTEETVKRNNYQTSQLNTSINHQNMNTSIEDYKYIIQSMNETKRENESDTLINQPIQIENEEYSISCEKEKIITLKDMNKNFSDKIKKKLKMRKKIEQIKRTLELRRKEKNKNLVEVYSNIISKQLDSENKKNDISKNIAEELINRNTDEYDSEIFTQILDTQHSEKHSTIRKFDDYSFEIIESESFQINS
jgi:hypothetical protein